MTQSLKNRTFLFTLILILSQCKDTYVSPYVSPPTGYLVVEGYITGNGPTQVRLSHTMPLPGNSNPPPETKAQLQVEGDDNTLYQLTEQGNGFYGVDTLPLKPTAKYRLRIHTSGNKEYLSDYTPFRSTPAIDSISWAAKPDGLDIYANTHDPSNATRYYQWQYDETWKYTAAEYSNGVYQTEKPWVVFRNPEDQIYNCWRGDISTTIILGSSAKLTQDVIYLHLLNHIAPDAQQLSNKYSIHVRQYALTEEAYNYLTLMQKNSESLGSIFDAQPTQLKGNIHGLSDPAEQVIGYVSAGTVQQQRIFIDRIQLPDNFRYFNSCPQKDTALTPVDSAVYALFFGRGGGFLPVDMHYTMGIFDGWTGNSISCVDCRVQGGTTQKPSFWPN